MADIFNLYKPVRNKIASLSCEDALRVVWAYSQHLQFNGFKIPGDIEVSQKFLTLEHPQTWIAEWNLELLAKEIILNCSTASRSDRTLRKWSALADVINDLKALEDRISALGVSSENILMELSRVAHRQFIWQENRPNAESAIRYFKIFNTTQINQICSQTLAISVADIYLCGMAFLGAFFSNPAVNAPFKLDFDPQSEEKIANFLSYTSRTIPELKKILQKEQRYDTTFVYAYNPLRAVPLVSMRYQGKESIVCPLPTLLFWRLTGGLYYELLHHPAFPQAFGDAFQQYVGDVIRNACPGGRILLLAEQTYGMGKEHKRSVDWIVADSNSAIFLECKAKRLSWSAKVALDDLRPLEDDIDRMADAVVQVYKTTIDYKLNKYSHFPFQPGRKIYPVVATLENWHLFGPVMLEKLHASITQKFESLAMPRGLLEDMPYSVWDIRTVEVAMQIIQEVGIGEFIRPKIDDRAMREWEWHAYISKSFRKYLLVRKLFKAEFDAMFSKIIRSGA